MRVLVASEWQWRFIKNSVCAIWSISAPTTTCSFVALIGFNVHLFQTSQGPPPPYPNQQAVNNGAIPTKRFKVDEPVIGRGGVPHQQTPPFYLSSQQMQILQNLQKRRDSLSPQEQNAYKHLLNQYNMMHQHQQQLRQQQSQQIQPNVGQHQQSFQQVPQSGTVAQTGFAVDNSTNFPAATGQSHQNAGMPYNSANVCRTNQHPLQSQPGVVANAPAYTQITSTSLAENMLKQFGGVANTNVNIKKEIDDSGCGSTSPGNIVADSTTNVSTLQRPIKCEATSTSARPVLTTTDIKNEPMLKIENIFEPTPKTQFTIDMDSRQIADAVKYVLSRVLFTLFAFRAFLYDVNSNFRSTANIFERNFHS